MRIKNTGGMSVDDVQEIVNNGGRFVYYPYTLSFGFFSFRLKSALYLIHPDQKKTRKRYYFIMLSFLFGWWGVPFGPGYTLKAIRTNLRGGKNMTNEVMAVINGYALFEESQNKTRRTKLVEINL
jgi:hypothetical protein